MNPRLESSKKWTPFPADFTEKIHAALAKSYANEVHKGEFLVEGRLYPEEILIRIGFLENGRLRQVNFEASLDYSQEKQNAMERIYLGLDALSEWALEYFANPDVLLEWPLHWKAFEFQGTRLYVQFSTINTRLEAEADRILGLDQKQLVLEHDDNEDALSNALVDTELAAYIQKEIRRHSSPDKH